MSQTQTAAKKKAAPNKKERVDKIYETIHYHSLSFALKCGRGEQVLISKYNGKPLDYPRAIRHCPGQRSIFKDEQPAITDEREIKALVEPIVFIKGFFKAEAHETITQEFLDNHPDNGRIFKEVDEGAEAEEFVDTAELKMDAKHAVRTKIKEEGGVEVLRMIVVALTSDSAAASTMTPAQLKLALYDEIDNNVMRFTNDNGDITIFDDQDIVRGALAKMAFKAGVVEISGDGNNIIWESNKSVISLVPEGADHEEYLANYFGTKEGINVAREVKKRL